MKVMSALRLVFLDCEAVKIMGWRAENLYQLATSHHYRDSLILQMIIRDKTVIIIELQSHLPSLLVC